MKTLQSFLLIAVFSIISLGTNAQKSTTETFNVSGNCGMCKKTIEQAAKDAGATSADWNKETKKLTVEYAKNTSLSKIQQKIADAGYDNAGASATDEAYNKLHACCQYERTEKVNNKPTADKNEKDAAKNCCDKS